MKHTTFTTPIEDRYFEDYEAGSVYEFGSIAVEEAEVLDFARRFDPQVFHSDPEAAKKTVFGGLIASGWHTAAMMMRLFADHFLSWVGEPGFSRYRRTALDQAGAPRR